MLSLYINFWNSTSLTSQRWKQKGAGFFQGFLDTDVSTFTSACRAMLQHKSYLTLTPDQEIKAGIPFILYIFL